MNQDKNKEIAKHFLNMYTTCLTIKYTIRNKMDCDYYLLKYIHYNKDSN